MTRVSPIPSAALPVGTLAEAIEAIVGPASIVDLSFPRASLVGNPALEATRMLGLPRSEAERNFLQRFRQSGGHAVIASVDLDDEFTWPPPLSRSNRSVVVSFEDMAAAVAAGPRLRSSGSAMLCPAPPSDGVKASKRSDRLSDYRRLRLIDRSGGPAYLLFVPRPPQRRSEPASPAGADDVDFLSDTGNAVIEARSMLHDGGYVSEGDVKYSWLWTGPSTHFRLILPQLAGVRPRLAELCVIRTEEDINLDRLAVQLDGRPVAHQIDRWSATSGKVSVEIPGGADYCVLTLVVPKTIHDTNSGRMIGLCLDKLVLAS